MPEDEAGREFQYLGVVSWANKRGGYDCVLRWGREPVKTLNREQALLYVAEVSWALTCAQFDAAVLAQAMELDPEGGKHIGGVILTALRLDRRPPVPAVTAPLVFTPIVSGRDFAPRINGRYGKTQWTWDLDTARQHITHVLTVAAGVDLDTAYLRYLKHTMELDDRHARGWVDLLTQHIPGTVDDPG